MNDYNERESQAELMRKKRASARDLKLPKVVDPKRRKACEADMLLALETYFPETFWGEWTGQRRAMVEAIATAAKLGGDQAIAAPRGEGKTSIAECVVVLLVLQGVVKFPLIAAATGPDAQRILTNIKSHLERNELLCEDYPEVCYPIQSLEGAPQRAGSQTVNGKRTFLKWAQDYVVLPTVKGSKASGSVLMTRGLDAAIRGIRVNSVRPDLVVIDDPETRESVNSESQTEKRELTIEQDLAGLGGPGLRLSRIMLTTIMRRESLSDKYTDQQKKSSWHGKRFQFVEQWPARMDLSDEYIQLRQADMQTGDDTARGAHAFFLEHQESIEAGSKMANPGRFLKDTLPDGTQLEVSPYQHALNIIADRGRKSFDCELQNSPPEESGPIDSGLTAHRVQTQTSGYAKGIVPPGCAFVTQGIDVRKVALHWLVRAWRDDATSFIIDYGIEEVIGTHYGSDEGVDLALQRAIRSRYEATKDGYKTLDGSSVSVDQTIIDAGWRTDAIYHSCQQLGSDIKPAMGFGHSPGAVQARFEAPARPSRDRRPGEGWFLKRQPGGTWLVCMDADRWKSFEHDRWLTPTDKPGTAFIWGESSDDGRLSFDEKAHHSISRHIVAESEVEEVIKGKLKRSWKAKNSNNHWLDAAYMSSVAGAMMGVRLLQQQPQQAGQAAATKAGGWMAAQGKRKGR